MTPRRTPPLILLSLVLLAGLALILLPQAAQAAPAPPTPPTDPTAPGIDIDIGGTNPDGSRPATSLVIVLGLTLLQWRLRRRWVLDET